MLLAYCFIGPLPQYAIDTIHQIRLFFDGTIYFIINDTSSNIVPILQKKYNINIIDYQDVISKEFNNTIEQTIQKFEIVPSLKGREKLFIYAFERFFLLENLMTYKNLENVFFVELDNLIYDNPDKWEKQFSKKDMAYMIDNIDRFASGVAYFKNANALSKLNNYFLSFIKNSQKFMSEMFALYEFWEINRDIVQILPTHWPTNTLPSSLYDNYDFYNSSIFDAAALGIYLGGRDPHHTNGIVVKGLRNDYSILDCTSYNFKWEKDNMGRAIPYVLNTINNTWCKINNLHIHSKHLADCFSKPLEGPIVFINVYGGLGNQMFQIANAYSYSRTHSGDLKILRHKIENDNRPLYWNNILSKFTEFLTDTIPNNLEKWEETGATEFNTIPNIPQNGIHLIGYYQSPKYFNTPTIQKELKELFKPNEELFNNVYRKYKPLIDNKERIVVVHTRRTDYLRNQDIINFHGPLSVDYYKTAINKMSQIVSNPIFLLSSDDISFWASVINETPQLNETNIFILDNENDINTLILLSQFEHYIIANSTFSWWAAWLSDNPKKVIAPSKWFGPTGPQNYKDIYLPNWEQV